MELQSRHYGVISVRSPWVIGGFAWAVHFSTQRESTRRRRPTWMDGTSPRFTMARAKFSDTPIALANPGIVSSLVVVIIVYLKGLEWLV